MKFPLKCGCEFEYYYTYWVEDPVFPSFHCFGSANTSNIKICSKHDKQLKEEAFEKFRQRQQEELSKFEKQYLSKDQKEK